MVNIAIPLYLYADTTYLKGGNRAMHKTILIFGFCFALLSTVILHAKVNTQGSAKTYETVAAQFSYHVPETEQCCMINYLF
jgi:hypothetical protein